MANENEGVQTTAETTEQTKYLDKDGLKTFWGKVKALVTAAVATIASYTVNGKKISTNPVLTKADIGLNSVDNTSDAAKPVSTAQATAIADAKKAGTDAAAALADHKTATNPHGIAKSTIGLGNVTNDAQVKRSEMGKANGVATLDANGRVPLAQLGNLDTSLYIIPTDNKLPTTGIKTNKIYLIKETSGTDNVYTEYIYVNNAWEKLGQFKADVDLTPYAKLDGGNQFTGQQVVYDDETDYRVQIDNLGVTIGDGDNDLAINNSGIKVTNGSASTVFNTNGGTVNMTDYVAKSTYNTDKNSMTNALNNKLDKTGGTINGSLAVTGALTKGGKAVLTDHQAIYSLTVQKNGSSIGTFNPKSANATINVPVPTKLSELTDDNVVKGKYLPLKDGGKIVGSGDSTFYTDITNGAITVGDSDTSGDSILINRNGFTKKQGGTTIGSGTQAFATNGGTINMTDYATKSAMKTELAKYLLLTGGIMNGALVFKYNNTTNVQIANNTGNVTARKFALYNGTATQALMADGSVAERITDDEIAAICV